MWSLRLVSGFFWWAEKQTFLWSWVNVNSWGPAVQHLLLNSTSISRSQTGCRALDHLSPRLTPLSRVPTPLYLLTPLPPFLSQFTCIFSPFIQPVLSLSLHLFPLHLSLSLWASALLSPPGTIALFHPPSHRLGSKTGTGSWEAINQQKLGIGALPQNQTTADFFKQSLN